MPSSGSRAPSSRGLTLHTQPVGAVLGVEQGSAAVSASVLGRGRHALSTAPVGTLGATGRPLAPLCPRSIHCRSTAHGAWEHARRHTHGYVHRPCRETHATRTAPYQCSVGAPGGQRAPVDTSCHSDAAQCARTYTRTQTQESSQQSHKRSQRTHSQTSRDRHTDGDAVRQRQKDNSRVGRHAVPDSQVQECRLPTWQLWDPGQGAGTLRMEGRGAHPQATAQSLCLRLPSSQGRTIGQRS